MGMELALVCHALKYNFVQSLTSSPQGKERLDWIAAAHHCHCRCPLPATAHCHCHCHCSLLSHLLLLTTEGLVGVAAVQLTAQKLPEVAYCLLLPIACCCHCLPLLTAQSFAAAHCLGVAEVAVVLLTTQQLLGVACCCSLLCLAGVPAGAY
ncbi:hypothetical protein SLEP1_g45504 [Rubroshorea leprosula]|uniref:Uncharacterized protein n=1 Tax=Rubroshorea leprosula TaxID=152421 RepID=A0AAV5LJ63_9ROSI|nr:hypothetical protein SLEP1_g45504 [Rubroshorea leprosula]